MFQKKKMLTITQININQLIQYSKNSRKHSKKQIDALAKSIQRFGFNVPIVIDEHFTILAGHARVEAAQKLNIEKVPVVQIKHLSELDKKAFIIADNSISTMATWDYDVLQEELKILKTENYQEYKDITNLEWAESKQKLDYKDIEPVFDLVVECKDEKSVQHLYEELTEKGYTCRAHILN